MAFMKASTKAEDVSSGSGGKHITKSGAYPVRVLAPIVDVSKNGSTTINLYVDHKGQKQVIYGNLRISNNDGSDNKIGKTAFNQLLICAGIEEVAEPVEADLPIGKKEAMKTVAILEDLCDVDVILRVQMEFSKWKGSYQEKKTIRGFFRDGDFASAEEIVNESDVGAAWEREQEYLNNITYKDVTPEEIQDWIKAKRPKGTAPDNGSGDTPKEKPSFGKKRTFGK